MDTEERIRRLEFENLALRENIWEITRRFAMLENLVRSHILTINGQSNVNPDSASVFELYKRLSNLEFFVQNLQGGSDGGTGSNKNEPLKADFIRSKTTDAPLLPQIPNTGFGDLYGPGIPIARLPTQQQFGTFNQAKTLDPINRMRRLSASEVKSSYSVPAPPLMGALNSTPNIPPFPGNGGKQKAATVCTKLCGKYGGHICGQTHVDNVPCPPCRFFMKGLKLKCGHKTDLECYLKDSIADFKCLQCDANTKAELQIFTSASNKSELSSVEDMRDVQKGRYEELEQEISGNNNNNSNKRLAAAFGMDDHAENVPTPDLKKDNKVDEMVQDFTKRAFLTTPQNVISTTANSATVTEQTSQESSWMDTDWLDDGLSNKEFPSLSSSNSAQIPKMEPPSSWKAPAQPTTTTATTTTKAWSSMGCAPIIKTPAALIQTTVMTAQQTSSSSTRTTSPAPSSSGPQNSIAPQIVSANLSQIEKLFGNYMKVNSKPKQVRKAWIENTFRDYTDVKMNTFLRSFSRHAVKLVRGQAAAAGQLLQVMCESMTTQDAVIEAFLTGIISELPKLQLNNKDSFETIGFNLCYVLVTMFNDEKDLTWMIKLGRSLSKKPALWTFISTEILYLLKERKRDNGILVLWHKTGAEKVPLLQSALAGAKVRLN